MQSDNLTIGKIFILSDLHFGKYNNQVSWKDYMMDYLKNEFVKSAYENGLNKDTDELFILGDVFNSREAVNTMILTNVVELLKELKKHFKTIRIIVGNHDAYYIDNNDITSVRHVQEIVNNDKNKNLICYDKPEQLIINGKKVLLLPWNNNYTEVNEFLSKDDSDYLFCHADINEMKYDSGIEIKDGINKDNFSKYKKIFSGHIHIRQEKKNILYVGTPYQLEWGDLGNTKGYYYIDCENFSYNFVENTFSPRFQKVLIYDLLDYSIEEAKKAIDNCFVHVLCDTKTYTNLNIIQLSEKIIRLGIKPRTIKFKEVPDYNKELSNIEDLSKMKFDMIETSRTILKEQNKSESEIQDILDYMQKLHEQVKKEE